MRDFPKKQLVIHYLLGICTAREEREVENWLKQDAHNIHLMQQVAKHLDEKPPLSSDDKQEIKMSIFNEIDRQSSITYGHTSSFNRNKRKGKGHGKKHEKSMFKVPRLWLKAAAVMLVVFTAAVGGYYYYNQSQADQKILWQKRIIPYGQTATFRFSDGTAIKLNGGSTLRYPTKFVGPLREVYLKGEAFFSVAQNKSKPFVVHAGGITARVLGTAFNIEAYEKESNVQVAVKEGKVFVSQTKADAHKTDNSEPVILTENQWVTYYKRSDIIETGEGDIWEMIAWKEDVLVFNNKTLAEAARILERWYGVTVKIKDETLKDVILAGVHEDVSLKEVLESIQFILGIEYNMKGDSVTISLAENSKLLKKAG